MRIVVALGGNALGNNAYEQLELVRETAKPLVDLIEENHELVIVHGNGPQVGMINNGMAEGGVDMPFPECGAMSQGYIGFHLQNAVQNELASRGINKKVATVITQVVVDKNDAAFQKPTKPIGAFMSKEEADVLAETKGFTMVEDAGRGYRRVVPSPKPLDIQEKELVKSLVEAGDIVITCGGGGIPVLKDNGQVTGVPAVIDKDFAAELAAQELNADYLVILTAVEKVAINWGKPNEKWLENITPEEADQYSAEGHFAPGSMLPKVQACVKFAKSGKGRNALITSLEKAKDGLAGKTGTVIAQ